MSAKGISFYQRYRDDIFFIADSMGEALAFKDELIRLSAPMFVVELEKVSPTYAEMLDLMTIKRERNGYYFLDWEPFVKPTARHIPLSPTSLHPKGVHNSWPISEVRRMHNRCRDIKHFPEHRDYMIDRFSWFFLDPQTIKRCSEWNPKFPRYVVEPEPVYSKSRDIKLIVPFHPALKGLCSFLNRALEPHFLWVKRSVGIDFRLRVVWRKHDTPLAELLKGHL